MNLREKMCSKCRKVLPMCGDVPTPEGEHPRNCKFYKAQNSIDGHGYYCKRCHKTSVESSKAKRAEQEVERRRAEEKRENLREYMREYMREYARRRKQQQVAS